METLMKGLDGPRTAQQELFYDLEDAASIIGWSVTQLTAIAGCTTKPDEVVSLMKTCTLLRAQEEKLRSYASETKVGLITRLSLADPL